MAQFEWRTLKFRVGEMSRGRALECSNAFVEYLQTVKDTEHLQAEAQREVDYLFVSHAPVTILVGGDVLENGKHTLDIGDDETLALVLPLSHSGFEALPVSLAAVWSQAAEDANGWLVNHFLDSLRIPMANIHDSSLVNESSSN